MAKPIDISADMVQCKSMMTKRYEVCAGDVCEDFPELLAETDSLTTAVHLMKKFAKTLAPCYVYDLDTSKVVALEDC